METYMPEDFFEEDVIAPIHGVSNGSDFDDIIVTEANQIDNEAQGEENLVDTRRDPRARHKFFWNGMFWQHEDEYAEKYFREDPVANAHHSEWHVIGSGGGGVRWGEYFYFMHHQMMARYEAERKSLGLSATLYYTPDLWDKEVTDTYNPRLGPRWRTRLPGTINARPMHARRTTVESLANSASFIRGEDTGINNFGHEFEYGLHGVGHMMISELSRGGRGGVMGSPFVAMRDPIFYRWHGYVNSMFQQYKNSLGPYTDSDLGFDGVRVVSSHVQPQWGDADAFYTYRERTSVMFSHSGEMRTPSTPTGRGPQSCSTGWTPPPPALG